MKAKANNNDILIGKALRRQRRLNEFTCEELGEELEVSKTMVTYYEQGKFKVSLERLQKCADLFGISLSSLLPPVTKKARNRNK